MRFMFVCFSVMERVGGKGDVGVVGDMERCVCVCVAHIYCNVPNAMHGGDHIAGDSLPPFVFVFICRYPSPV